MKPVVYVIEFSSGRRYVGATVNFKARKQDHRHAARLGKQTKLLQPEFDADPAPVFRVVASGLSKQTLHELETQVIRDWVPELNVVRETLPIGQRQPESKISRQARWKRQKKDGTFMPRPQKELTVNGVTYTASHAAKVFGVPIYNILTRLKRGWTPEQVVGLHPRPVDLKAYAKDARARAHAAKQEDKKLLCDGVSATLADHCRRLGIPYGKAKYRIDRGLTLDEIKAALL